MLGLPISTDVLECYVEKRFFISTVIMGWGIFNLLLVCLSVCWGHISDDTAEQILMKHCTGRRSVQDCISHFGGHCPGAWPGEPKKCFFAVIGQQWQTNKKSYVTRFHKMRLNIKKSKYWFNIPLNAAHNKL